jgi:UDP-3-O-[3-hydroxymyristoyl] N-acetylglucosamine deacetylase
LDHQHTLASPVRASGVGLHTGVPVNLALKPAPANTGLIFKRVDLEGFEIEARARNVARVAYATSLMKKGVLISTTEHLLAAFAGARVDNALIELDNLELPILDGSALPFCRLIAEAGLKRQRARRIYAKILRPVIVEEGTKRIAVYPAEEFRVTYRIDFSHPLIGRQSFCYAPLALAERPSEDGLPGSADFTTDIAPARTFSTLEEAEMLRKNGLVRGGSLENAVVIGPEGVLTPGGLRFSDEFCRHKLLDLVGDLVMLGHRLLGHAVVERGGHALHYALVSRLLRERDAWTLTTHHTGRVVDESRERTSPRAKAAIASPLARVSVP